MGIKNLCVAAVIVLALSLAGATQLRADDIQYVYQFGGNTFTWDLPTNPVIAPGDVSLGQYFTIPDASFTENGTVMTGTFDFYSSSDWGGFDLWSGNTLFCNAFGSQLYTGPEDSSTMLSGTFLLFEQGNSDILVPNISDSNGATLNVIPTPEPSALALLAMGLAFGAAIFAFKKN